MFQVFRNKMGKLLMVLPILFFAGFLCVLTGNADAATTMKFDFGNGGSVSGYTQVTASTAYSSQTGYGFNTPANMKNVSAAGSGVLSDAVQFVTSGMTSTNTFNVDLTNGLYEVTVYLGNTTRTSIAAEGVFQVINMTGNNATASFTLPITDGQLNILATAGKDGYAFTLSALEITKISDNPVMPQTIWLCGDSTVCNYYPLETSTQCGWGQLLDDYVDSALYVRNMASSGQYAKGFVNSGQFDSVLKYLKAGDYYVISVGINDGNYSNQTEYYETVTSMVEQAKAKGATVILVKQQGRATDVSLHPNLTGRWYGSILDTIGTEQNVKVVDLFNLSFDYYKSIGQDATTALFIADGLHPNREGAKVLAKLVADDVNFTVNSTTATTEPSVSADTSLDGKVFMLKNVNSGLYMDVADGIAANLTNVQQWGASSAAAYNTWKAVLASDGYYYLYSQIGDGKTYLLDVNAGKAANGTNIQIYQNSNSNAQLFKFQKNADGSYTILTKVSNDTSCVEVVSALTNSGANVQEWEVNGHNCQKWILEEVSYTAGTSPSPSPSPSASTSPSPSPSQSTAVTGSVTVANDVNSWNGGFCANFTLTNQSSQTVKSWTLKLKKSDFPISGSWNVTIAESGDYYLLSGVDWNSSINGNAAVSFGFTCNGTYNSSYYYELVTDGTTASNTSATQATTVSPSPSTETVKANPTVYIAGDSTVQTYKASYYPQQGWGAYLSSYLGTNVTVSNHAIAGRSSKSFIEQGRLATILNSIQKGDYLLVQFAINDANYNNADRYAPVGDGSEGTYQYYIKQFVEGAINKGATPILVTTTLSLGSYQNGKFVNNYTTYCDAMKSIANEYGIPCIDLNTLMVDHFNSIGYSNAYNYYMISSSDTSTDKTHFTETGAKAVASLVANAIKSLNVDLANYVV